MGGERGSGANKRELIGKFALVEAPQRNLLPKPWIFSNFFFLVMNDFNLLK